MDTDTDISINEAQQASASAQSSSQSTSLAQEMALMRIQTSQQLEAQKQNFNTALSVLVSLFVDSKAKQKRFEHALRKAGIPVNDLFSKNSGSDDVTEEPPVKRIMLTKKNI